jgi:hypothetical protein
VPAKFRFCDANGNSIGTAGVVTDFRIVQMLAGTVYSATNELVDSTTPLPFRLLPGGANQFPGGSYTR